MKPEFIDNMKPITDLIKYIPPKLIENNDTKYSLSWYVTPYGNIAIKITGGSDIYNHANIIFKGDGHLKIYFYFYTEAEYETPDPCIANVHFSKCRDNEIVQNEILNILNIRGGFNIGG